MRLRLTDLALPLVAVAALVTACGGTDAPKTPIGGRADVELTGAQAHAPAPVTAATLTLVPDSEAARTRLGYVNVDALGKADGVDGDAITRAVLGDLSPADGAATAVRVDDELFTAGPAPQTSAITPLAQSAVQSCLGDTLAQTTFGPATVGKDAALGAGIGRNGDDLELRICGAPHFLREIHRMEHALVEEFGEDRAGENEIGEREIAQAHVPLADVDPELVVAVLRGGDALSARSWSKKATRR